MSYCAGDTLQRCYSELRCNQQKRKLGGRGWGWSCDGGRKSWSIEARICRSLCRREFRRRHWKRFAWSRSCRRTRATIKACLCGQVVTYTQNSCNRGWDLIIFSIIFNSLYFPWMFPDSFLNQIFKVFFLFPFISHFFSLIFNHCFSNFKSYINLFWFNEVFSNNLWQTWSRLFLNKSEKTYFTNNQMLKAVKEN